MRNYVVLALLMSAPALAADHPDFNGYWIGTKDTVPGGNIAKDQPGLKLPFTPAGEAAWKHNVTATIDPESICIIMKRGNTSAIPANASRPRRDTHHVSINPVEACASITMTFGHAMRNRIGTIGPCSSRLVRGFIAGGRAIAPGPSASVTEPWACGKAK